MSGFIFIGVHYQAFHVTRQATVILDSPSKWNYISDRNSQEIVASNPDLQVKNLTDDLDQQDGGHFIGSSLDDEYRIEIYTHFDFRNRALPKNKIKKIKVIQKATDKLYV